MPCNCGGSATYSAQRTIGAQNGAPPIAVYVTSPWYGLRPNKTYSAVTGTAVTEGINSGYLVAVTESVPG